MLYAQRAVTQWRAAVSVNCNILHSKHVKIKENKWFLKAKKAQLKQYKTCVVDDHEKCIANVCSASSACRLLPGFVYKSHTRPLKIVHFIFMILFFVHSFEFIQRRLLLLQRRQQQQEHT